MKSRKIAALAALSLMAASSAAVAQSARPLSLANTPGAARASASLSGESELRNRGAGFYLIGAVVLGLVIWGIIKLTDDNERAFPTSP